MNYDACERERGIETVLGGRYDGTRRREEREPARGQKPSATMIRRRRRRLRPVPYTGSGLVGGKKLWSLLNEPAAYPTAERRERGIRQRERKKQSERKRGQRRTATDRSPTGTNEFHLSIDHHTTITTTIVVVASYSYYFLSRREDKEIIATDRLFAPHHRRNASHSLSLSLVPSLFTFFRDTKVENVGASRRPWNANDRASTETTHRAVAAKRLS